MFQPPYLQTSTYYTYLFNHYLQYLNILILPIHSVNTMICQFIRLTKTFGQAISYYCQHNKGGGYLKQIKFIIYTY